MTTDILKLIEAKRDGAPLSQAQIEAIVTGAARGSVPDYQLAALLMAIFFRGLNREETRALTLAMRDSGEVLHFPDDDRPVVDKHSTGGVGDKVSLPLAPLLACLGLRVPMISGRGLGITGGTLDKLESIPGFNTQLSPERIVANVQDIGCVICGQTPTMVPADRALYALRDVTGTVPSIPLITASILSKKLAESPQTLLLDVKFGAAAFMQNLHAAHELARSMVDLGKECGVRTRALLTAMDAPLGRAAGNWLEVRESVACLEGCGPEDLKFLVIECAAHLLEQCGLAADVAAARDRAAQCLASGAPRAKWDEMLQAQDADMTAFESKLSQDVTAPIIADVRAGSSGFITRCDAKLIGEVVRDLGGGRLAKDSIIDAEVGLDEMVKPGEPVASGAVLARVHARTPEQAQAAAVRLGAAWEIGEEKPGERELVRDVVE